MAGQVLDIFEGHTLLQEIGNRSKDQVGLAAMIADDSCRDLLAQSHGFATVVDINLRPTGGRRRPPVLTIRASLLTARDSKRGVINHV